MPAALAKLTPPRLMRVIVRERLHRLLDGGVRAPAVWFGAAAGSGKTTAAAEFLAARKASVCWYRVDAGDLDLASFFFYLARVAPIARSKKALPVFGPEFSEQPVPFARRFFRDLYSRLPAESAVVFDDLHVAAATLLPAIVAIAIEELPPDFRLFLLSREQAPATFAGFRATDRLGVIDEDSLRFDEEETSAFIRRRIGTAVDQDTQQRLRTGARGWAAGLVLLSEQAARGTSAAAQIRVRPGQILFDYFGREVFGCMEEADQHFMEFTALLSEFTAKAAAIIALRDDAQSVVDDLCRRQLFVTRIADRPPRYLYHDLFRAFLLERLQGRLDADLLNAARLRAADAALADDRPDQAITLCLDGGDFDRATDLLCAQAPSLIQQGRRATLRSFAQRIPVAIATRQPWLDYWLGVAGMVDDHTVALKHFERAHVEFTASNDMPAVCLNAAQALLAIHMSWATNVGGAAWVERLNRSATAANVLAPGHQLRVTAALLRAAAMDETYRVNEESIAVATDSALLQLEGTSPDIDVNDRLLAADALQEHAMNTGQPALFERTVAAITPHLPNRSLTSWAKCHWLISFGTVSGRRYPYQKVGFPYATAEAALQEAWTTCQREGFADLRFAATLALINVARAAGDDEQARTLVARLDAECNPARPTQVYNLMSQKALQFARDGHYAAALKANDAARDAAGRAQLPLSELWSGWITNAQILIALNRCEEAGAFMREHAPEFSGVFRQAMEILAASADAWPARRDAAPDYGERLRRCMADVRAMGWTNYMTAIPAIAAHLWSDALEHGVEREFIVAAIRRRRLAPPARYAPD